MPLDEPPPTMPVTLALSGTIIASRPAERRLRDEIRRAVEQAIGGIAGMLGIPGEPRVTVEVVNGSEEPNPATRPFRLTVNGRRCRISAEEVQQVIGYLQETLAAPRSHLLGIVDALRGELTADGEGPDPLVEFLAVACAQAVRRRPGALLSEAQCEAYLRALTDAHGTPPRLDASGLLPVLRGVLELRVSLADVSTVAEIIDSALEPGGLTEALIDRLNPRGIELQVRRELLDEVMNTPEDYASAVASFQEAMKDQFGIALPAIRVVAVEDLHPRAMRIKIGDITGLPWMLLPAGTCTTNAEPASLERFSLTGTPMLHPSGGTATVISREDAEKASDLGLSVLTPMQHALACLGATLRTHAACLIDTEYVERALETFAHSAPLAVTMARANLQDGRLVALLRRLVAHGLSVANLPLIVNLLEEYRVDDEGWPVCAAPIAAELTGERRPPDAQLYVRAGMPRSSLRRWLVPGRAAPTPVLLLDPAVEAEILELGRGGALPAAFEDRLLDALQEELDFIPPGRGIPILVVPSRIQRLIRSIVIGEFPLVGVIARLELPPEAEIEELGRLRLSANGTVA